MPNLLLENVQFHVGGKVVLEDISWELRAGKTLAISGSSGKGKSTILDIILGLTQPSNGSVFLDDIGYSNLAELERARIRRSFLSSMQQEPRFVPALNVRQNVALAASIRKKPRSRGRQTHVSSVLDKFRVLHLAKRKVEDLSSGEKQRVALARAFSGDPAIICLDEPITGIDDALSDEIIDVIFQLQSERKSSLVIATNNQEIIERCNHHYDTNWYRWKR